MSKQAPPTYYKDKYRHLLGADSGKDAAKATKSNSAYGYGKITFKRGRATHYIFVSSLTTGYVTHPDQQKIILHEIEVTQKNLVCQCIYG